MFLLLGSAVRIFSTFFFLKCASNLFGTNLLRCCWAVGVKIRWKLVGGKKILQAVIVLRMFVSSLEQVKSYLGSAAPVSVLICDALCISFHCEGSC